jgi:hypothetical protein
MTGGVAALVGAKMLGPRIGKFGPNGEVNAIPGHNIALAALGTFILAFGWFGFNAGSTLAGTDARISVVAVNTMLASAAGACSATLYVWLKFGRPDVTWMCNGMLAGLVAITAPCAFVSAPASMVIGTVAGVLVVHAALFVETRFRVDDPVGAIAVHGANGAWGVIALGLFANGTYGDGLNGVPGPVRGLFHGDGGQLAAALIAIVAQRSVRGLGQRDDLLGDRQGGRQPRCRVRRARGTRSTRNGYRGLFTRVPADRSAVRIPVSTSRIATREPDEPRIQTAEAQSTQRIWVCAFGRANSRSRVVSGAQRSHPKELCGLCASAVQFSAAESAASGIDAEPGMPTVNLPQAE